MNQTKLKESEYSRKYYQLNRTEILKRKSIEYQRLKEKRKQLKDLLNA